MTDADGLAYVWRQDICDCHDGVGWWILGMSTLALCVMGKQQLDKKQKGVC